MIRWWSTPPYRSIPQPFAWFTKSWGEPGCLGRASLVANNRLVELGYIDAIFHETVRQTLKKTISSRDG